MDQAARGHARLSVDSAITRRLLLLCAVIVAAAACSSPGSLSPAPSPTPAETRAASAEESPTSQPSTVATVVELDPVSAEPSGGTHSGFVSVTLSSESGGSIRYTVDGTEPTTSNGITYEGAFDLDESAVIKAVAVDELGNQSGVSIAEYEIDHPKLDPPTIELEQGVYVGSIAIEITSNEPGAEIVFTLDGSEPSADNGLQYDGPVSIDSPTTIKTAVVRRGYTVSDVVSSRYWVYASEETSNEDISLGSGEAMVIEDTYFVHRGNIHLEGDAQLVIRDSMIQFDKEYAFQFSLEATGNSQVIVENSSIANSCTGSLNWAFFDDSSLIADAVDHGNLCNTWNFMSGDSSVQIADWEGFGGTVCDRSQVSIADSARMEVEFCLPDGLTLDRSFPLQLDHFEFGSNDDPKMEFNLVVENSWVDGWGLNLLPGSDLTIRDTPSVTFGIIGGSAWNGQTVEVENLRRGLIEDETWTVGDARLRLINTYVYGWEPNAFGTTTMIIRNSDYSGSSVNSADAVYIIEDSTADLLRAGERVQMTVRRSQVPGDVIAAEDSLITLIDCHVEGNVIASGNGRVVLVNTTVDGNVTESENGEVTVENPA